MRRVHGFEHLGGGGLLVLQQMLENDIVVIGQGFQQFLTRRAARVAGRHFDQGGRSRVGVAIGPGADQIDIAGDRLAL